MNPIEPKGYVDFLGMRVPVMSDERISDVVDSGEKIIYAVPRVADTDSTKGSPELRARRIRTLCERCDAVCWMDPLGYGPTKGKGVIICLPCVAPYYDEQKKAAEKDS